MRERMTPEQDLKKRQYCLAFGLNKSIDKGDRLQAEVLLAAGAPVDGSDLLNYRPLTFAAVCGRTDFAQLFIERGCRLDAGVVEDVITDSGKLSVKKGTPALTMAIRNCHVDVFRLLVAAGADLDAADCTGFTPLMSACLGVEEAEKGVVMARALLEAGADPRRANDEGCIALTYAAAEGVTDVVGLEVVDMLLARAPDTVSHVSLAGATPLCAAVCHGKGEAVARLLAAGAVQPRLHQQSYCPLTSAVVNDNEPILRTLLRHLEVLGGAVAVRSALEAAVVKRRTRLLALLLRSEGEELQRSWARSRVLGEGRLLHGAASRGTVGMLSVLLAAGADEAQLDDHGRTASEVVGTVTLIDDDPAEHRAKRRVLRRAPAFRARSWAWRCDAKTAPPSLPAPPGNGVVGSSGGVADAPRKRKLLPGVRIYRPANDRFFVQRIGRYVLTGTACLHPPFLPCSPRHTLFVLTRCRRSVFSCDSQDMS